MLREARNEARPEGRHESRLGLITLERAESAHSIDETNKSNASIYLRFMHVHVARPVAPVCEIAPHLEDE